MKKYTGILLLSLFLSYYGGITLFRHAHDVGENTIVHSHPHGKNCHTHSAGELQFIQQLSLFLSLAVAGLLFLPGRFSRLADRFLPEAVSPLRSTRQEVRSLRGPPVW